MNMQASARRSPLSASRNAQRRSAIRGRFVPCAVAAGTRTGLSTDKVASWVELAARAEAADGDAAAAALSLSIDTTYECLDDVTVVDTFSAAYDGGLEDCEVIVDTHLRLLADCLLAGDASATEECYEALLNAPPLMRRQVTAATVAVGTAALEFVREEQAIIASVLDPESEQGRTARALVDAVDAVESVLPQPEPEAFED